MNISLPLTLENPLNLTKTICFGTRVREKQNMTSSLQNQRAVFLQIKTY